MGGRTTPHITINCVKGLGEVGRVLVCVPRVLILEVINEGTIPGAIGSLDEADRKCLSSGDGAE